VNSDFAKTGDKSLMHCGFLNRTWNWFKLFKCNFDDFTCV